MHARHARESRSCDDDVTHFDVQQIGRSKRPLVEGAIWPNIDATLSRRTTIKVAFGFASKLLRSTQPTLLLLAHLSFI
jgi:hypothetical protein